MKTKMPKSVIALVIITILCAGSLLVFGLAGETSPSGDTQRKTIEGVWQTSITFRNCQTGASLPIPPLSGLFTFHDGGTLSEYGNRPSPATPARGPGHGLWHREHGWQDHSFKFIFNRYNSAGEFIGTQVARGALQLETDGDSFSASATIQVLDSNGNIINSGCTTSVGERFE